MSMWPDTRPERSAPTAGAAAVAAAAPAGPPTREYRALVTFVVASVFITVAVLLFGGDMERVTSSASALPAGLLGMAVNVVAAWGLAAGRDWARYAMTPILWIYVGAGILVFLAALTHNGVNIPIGAILAAWALYSKPSEALGPVPAQSMEGTLLVLGAVVAAVIQFF